MAQWSMNLAWWIGVVEVPAVAGLLWLIHRARRDGDVAREALRAAFERTCAGLRDGLAAHRLEVARGYVSNAHLKDVETRLTEHLLRIEAKLDHVASRAGARRT